MKKKDKIPRYVLSLSDTKTLVPGPNGEQYYAITVGADHLADFNKLLPETEQTADTKTELQRVFMFMQEAVDKLAKVKDESIDQTK